MCPPSISENSKEPPPKAKLKKKKKQVVFLFLSTDLEVTYIVEALTLSRTSTRYFLLPLEPARELLERMFRNKHFSNRREN